MANFSLSKAGIKTAIIQAFYNEILTNSSSYYYFLGKTLPWGAVDEALIPGTNAKYEQETRNEIITLKKIQANDVAYIIPRYNWVAGTVYDIYDDAIDESNPAPSGATSIETSKFYCVTDEYNVYKCLWNNNDKPSTIKPYSTTHNTIETSDGYKWKYMYTIPVGLRNKFMTISDIPVTTAISNQYYTKGGINSSIVLKHGSGYDNETYIIVQGNGYLEENPFDITSMVINSQGAGYTVAPSIIVEDPFDSVPFNQETSYILGQKVKYQDRIYEVITAGKSGTSYPTHTSPDIVYNGSLALKFVGRTVTGTTTITGDKVTGITLNSFVTGIVVNARGYGYSGNPLVTITGDGVGAVAVANVVDSRIVGYTITNQGSGYTTATVSIASPMTSDLTWTSGGSVTLNNVVYYNDKFYKALNTGVLGTVPPTHTFGTEANGAVNLEYIGANAFGTVTLGHSYGYQRTPQVELDTPFTSYQLWTANTAYAVTDILKSGQNYYQVTAITGDGTSGTIPPSHTVGSQQNNNITLAYAGTDASASAITQKTRAIVVPIVENGEIIKTISVNPGVGYTTASFDIVSNSGSGAEIIPNLSVGDLDTKQANIELLAVPGTIDAIRVVNGGSNYSAASVVVTGDGVGCTAVATITDGKISNIVVTNPGYGYTKATVTINGNVGSSGAIARAIIAPPGGHGKNAVTELFAKDISLFTSISNDKNQGFTVNNDYRQLGIIKNPQQFTTSYRFDGILGSACYSVTATYDFNSIELDGLLIGPNGTQFRVVAKKPDSLLLQALDKINLQVGDILTWDNNSLIVSNFAYPTVNKYSGELLYIDNRNAFIPSSEQFVSIKTAIRF